MSTANDTYTYMGKPVKTPCLIPVDHKATPACIDAPFMVGGKVCGVTCVSFGTPHGVVFVDDLDGTDVAGLGASLGNHALFPEGASIVFAKTLDANQISARLWQLGQGEIKSTPEAVCAAMAAAKMLQKTGREAEVLMGGERFRVKWDSADDGVYYSGPQ